MHSSAAISQWQYQNEHASSLRSVNEDAASAASEARHQIWLCLSVTSFLESSLRVNAGPHYVFSSLCVENIYLNYTVYIAIT